MSSPEAVGDDEVVDGEGPDGRPLGDAAERRHDAPTEPRFEAIGALLDRVTTALPGGGEVRSGQRAMAEAVVDAIGERRHVVVRAGTGTGKSLGYLVPAIATGSRVVIATATKALQDQLANKDLPFLAEHLGLPFEFAVLKGRSNYFCWQRAREVAGAGGSQQLDLEGLPGRAPRPDEIAQLLAWAGTTVTGDRAELDIEPHPSTWAAVSVGSDECPGAARCPSGDICFAEKARKRAADADVIVVNTHLYGQHVRSGGYVLPEHDVVVLDEAHEVEDVMADCLGLELSPSRLLFVATRAKAVVAELDRTVDTATAAARLEAALSAIGEGRLGNGPMADERLRGALVQVSDVVGRILAAVRAVPNDLAGDAGQSVAARKTRAVQAATSLASELEEVMSASTSGPASERVAWIEPANGGRPPVLRVAPIEVGPSLNGGIWEKVSAVLTSATIPSNIVERLGLPFDRAPLLDVGSPFDFATQGLLYCATSLPDPRSPSYETAMHAQLVQLVRAAGGRTLALFTSWRALRAATAAAREADVGARVLAQGELPKPVLTREFADDETSCLFATMGFWQGIDVPGRALSLVVIDRLPFSRPDDPLLDARRDRAGARAFELIDLPRAATLLAQGAGRLIRTRSDRGVVAVLDPRLNSARYRWQLVSALPPMRRTKHIADVEAFLRDVLTASDTPSGTA